MKLKNLTLENFQRHKCLSIDFSTNITSIQGATDSGKSSLIRALRWICLNDFSGDEFVREGSDHAQVVIRFRHQKETHELIRLRKDRTNLYLLNGFKYQSFGSSVPEDISQCLRLSEINFQSQHDAPFWFTETAGEVSRRLNAVVDLSVIDTVLSEIAGTLREAEGNVRFCEQRCAELKESQEKLGPQLARIEEFNNLTQQNEIYQNQKETADHLASLLAECGAYQSQLDRLRLHIGAAGGLRKQVFAWLQCERQVSALHDLTKRMQSLAAITRPPDFGPVLEKNKSLQTTLRRVNSLESLVGEIAAMEQTLTRAREESKAAAQVYHKSTRGVKCPLCQNPM